MGGNLDWKLELVVELCDEHVVTECLPHLHDSNDRRVYLILSVVEDALRRRLLLFLLQTRKTFKHYERVGSIWTVFVKRYRFLHLHLVDFDSKELVSEFVVYQKLVAIFHVTTLK